MMHNKKPTIIALEPRMMFDAAGATTLTEVIQDTIDTTTLDAPLIVSEAATSAASVLERHEVAFVNASVQDYQSLIDGIGSNVDVYVVESSADGIAYMASVLENLKGIDALHVLGHGSESSITLGSTVLSQENLASYTQALSSIGNALDDTGDILLYGCYVGSGDGEAFIQSLADITKADIAASDDVTGLGGDWKLEVKSGIVDTEELNFPTYNSDLATPSISGLQSTTFIENGSTVIPGSSISITNGSSYDGKYIEYSLTNGSSADQLTLTSTSTINTSGAISVDGSNVYLGNGSSRDVIGSIDATFNGINGQKLRINFVSSFSNSSFETGTITGWTAMNQMIDLGSTTIAGWTSSDTSDYSNNINSGGNDNDIPSGSYSTSVVSESGNYTDGSYALKLTSTMTTANGYDVVHGPAVYSSEFQASAGDIIYFDWRAYAGGDNFDAFGYIVNVTTGTQIEVLDATGSSTTDWATKATTISTAGTYKFVFVNGTYDASGGRAAGGQLYIDNVKVYGSKVNDAVVTSISKLVTFSNTSEAPTTTARTFTVTAVDSNGYSGSASSTINVTSVNDLPYISGIETATVNEDTSITLSGISVSDADGTSLTVTIGANHGNLSLGSSSGLSVTGGSTHALTLTGTTANLNTALATLRYQGDANWFGSDPLTITINDGQGSGDQPYRVNQTGKFFNTENGHYYEFVSTSGITWDQAKTAAEARTLYGLNGYLVTITSATENALMVSMAGGNGWIGASDATSEGIWKWVTGPETGTQFWTGDTNAGINSTYNYGSVYNGQYANWASGEPNNADSLRGGEDVAHFYYSGDNAGTWNDFAAANTSAITGYIVEYGGAGGTLTAANLTITIASVNDAPTNTVPSVRTTNEDTAIVFSSANSNLISIADVDATSVTTTLSIESGKGTLTATTSSGATITNNGTTIVQITGTVAQVNAALVGLTYTPTANANGNAYATLTVATSDGTATDTDTIVINIAAVNDAPTFSSLTGISYTDTSALDTFTATTGTTSASDIDSTLVYSIIGTGVVDNSITANLVGTYGTLNLTKSTGAYTYTPNAGAINALSTTATETFSLQASDGSLSATQELTITLNGVNDAPIFGEIAQNYTGTTQIADGATAPSAAIEVLNNGLLKFGDGSIDSVNSTTGMLEQPWYYKDSAWYKLTYSSYMLNFAIAAEGDGTNIWNLNGAVNMSPSFNTATVDNSGFVANGGYGTIVYTGYITVGSTDLKVAQVYTLSQSGSFVKVTTQITNMEATDTATNLRIWVGTQDDWVGSSDGPTKVKGNIVDGEFVAISSATDPASAIKIYSGDSAVLFYSTSDNVNTSINSCCSFSNATNQSPCTSATTLTGDGSYAMFLRLDDLAPGTSQSLDWYYAAGATNEIASIVSSVAQAAAVGLSESNQGGLTSSGSYPISDIDTGDSVTASIVSVGALQQTNSNTTVTSSTFEPTNAALKDMFSISPTTVIDTTHTSGTLNWTFNSGIQTFDYLKAGEKLVLTYTLRATDSSTATADQTVTITINGTNDAPVHTVPSVQTILEDGSLTLSLANNNAVSLGITDDEMITTTLSVSGVVGTLHVNSGSGATITNDGSSSVQIVGSRAQINAALNGLVYTPTANANGTSSLQIVSSDGNSSDTDTLTITVAPVDDLPVATSMAATVGPTSKQLFSYFAPTFSDIEGEYPTAITITSLPTVGTFEVYDGSGDRGDDTNWITITSAPFLVAMNEMGNYRFNAGEATNDGTTAVVTWKVQTTGNTTSTGWSNEASGAITILNYTTNTTPTVSIAYPSGTTTMVEPQVTTQEFPNAITPISSIKTTTSGKVITINEDAQTATITLTYSDTITPSQFMQGLMQSSDTDLIDFSNASCYTMSQTVNESGQGVVTLVLKPKANMYGEAIITLGANDGQKTTAESFTLKVLPINETPIAQDFLRTIAEDHPFYFNAINPAAIYTDSLDANADANHQVNYDDQMAIIMAAQQTGATDVQQTAAGVAIQALVDANYFPKAFVIETLPSHGALYLGETAITSAGTSVLINQLSILTYRPNVNYYGNDSFQWHGVDQASNGTNGISSPFKVASFTMTPVNDIPVITGVGYLGRVTETNAAITINGELNVVDVDPNDIVILSVVSVSIDSASTFTGTNPLASSQMQAMLSIINTEVDANPNAGSTFGWHFTSGDNGNEAFDFLALGETLVLNYTVRATDDSDIDSSFDEQVITITINGSNDVPVVTNATSALLGTVVEAGNDDAGVVSEGIPTISGTLTSSDVDTLATKAWSIQGTPSTTYGTISIDSTSGDWTYTLDNILPSTQALIENETVTQTYIARVTDDKGAYVDQTITITINGSNDVPVTVLDKADALESGGLMNAIAGYDAVGNVLDNDTDVDRNDTSRVVKVLNSNQQAGVIGQALQGKYGSLVLNADGSFRYRINELLPQVEVLRENDTIEEVFTYTINDQYGSKNQAELRITINGAEDIPVPTPEVKNGESSLGGGTSFDSMGSRSLGGLLPSGQSDFGTQKTVTPTAQNIMILNEATASSALSTNTFVIQSVDQVPPYVARDVISGTSTGEGQSLRLNTPIEAQRFLAGEKVNFTLPRGTFIEIDPKANVMINVTLPNGAILPSWISFNPHSGEFTFDLSQTSQRIIELRIVAKDSNGVEVETILQIDIIQAKGEKTSDTPAAQSDARDIDKIVPTGKQGLHEQFAHAKAEETSFEALVAWLEEFVEDISLNTKESA